MSRRFLFARQLKNTKGHAPLCVDILSLQYQFFV